MNYPTEIDNGIQENSYSFLRKLLIALASLFVGLSVAGSAYLLYQSFAKSHLILGVPYQGSYLGTEINTDSAAAVMTILSYWGDDRFTVSDIAKTFSYSLYGSAQTNFGNLVSFFEQNGYDAKIISIEDKDGLISFLDKDVPIIVSQQISADAPVDTEVMRVFIGYSNLRRTFIVHDNNFGNNYEISYSDFKRLQSLDNTGGFGLVIEPTALTANLSRPLEPAPYEERLGIMGSEEIQHIQVHWVTIDHLLQDDNPDYAQIASLWEEIVYGPGFSQLHPAGRIHAAFSLGRIYTNFLNKQQEAIKAFDVAAKIGEEYDLKLPFGEWQRRSPEIYDDPWWYAAPRIGIGVANIRLYNESGDRGYLDAAEDAFIEARKYNPDNQDVKDFFDGNYSFAD